MSTITMGVDLAKSVFSVCAVDGAGHVQRRQDLGVRFLSFPPYRHSLSIEGRS